MDLVKEQWKFRAINLTERRETQTKPVTVSKNCRSQHTTHPNINSADMHRTGLVFMYVV